MASADPSPFMRSFTLGYSLLAVVVIALFLHPLLVSSQEEVEDEHEFDYVSASVKGPERWGTIKKEWINCSQGNMQSPIDLLHERVEVMPFLGRLRRTYKPQKAIVKNRGHDIMLKWESGAGEMFLNGSAFVLEQLHWHSPSEHTINGRKFDLEIHLVHKSSDNRIAVIGITYKIGRPDPFISALADEIKNITNRHQAEVEGGVIDPRLVKIGSRKYYRYMGSLTTPPCTEGVIWTISKKVRTVSKAQVTMLREAVSDGYESNARPVQAIHKRPVHLYKPQ